MDCLMKKKNKLVKKLKKGANSKLNVLHPSQSPKGGFNPSYVYFNGYSDLFITTEALINVCIIATRGNSKEFESDIHKTLELASSLLPIEEGEFLDEAYQMLVKNEKPK